MFQVGDTISRTGSTRLWVVVAVESDGVIQIRRTDRRTPERATLDGRYYLVQKADGSMDNRILVAHGHNYMENVGHVLEKLGIRFRVHYDREDIGVFVADHIKDVPLAKEAINHFYKTGEYMKKPSVKKKASTTSRRTASSW